MSFLESTIETVAKVEIEKEIQAFGSEPCIECGYYHGDDVDHTGEDNLTKKEDAYYRDGVDADTASIEGDLSEEEMEEYHSYDRRPYCEPDRYYYGNHHDDDAEDSNADDGEESDDDDDDDVPSLKLSEGIALSFMRRVKPDMPNDYVSGKKLELRNRYRKEVKNILEALINGYLFNHKQYLKAVYTTIRDCEDHDGFECYNKADGDIVEIPEEEAEKYVRVLVPDYMLDEYNISHSGDDEGEQ